MSENLSPRAAALREHRLTFEYARAHGVTLAEAEKLRARQRWIEAGVRLEQVQACGRVIEGRATIAHANERPHPLKPAPADAPWMMRD
jgi:hypothetical protein